MLFRSLHVDLSDLFVGLAAFAELGIGLPYLVAAGLGLGAGQIRAVTYEYGNTFLIVAGLLNMLVALDAYDRSVRPAAAAGPTGVKTP